MMVLALAGAGLGALGGYSANLDRIDQEKLAIEKLKRQKESNLRSMNAASQILKGDFTIGAMQNTAESKGSAIQAFQEKAKGEVAAGQSGTTGGTPFYNLDSYVVNARNTLIDQNKAMNIGMSNKGIQGAEQIAQYRDIGTEIGAALTEQQKQLDYAESPLGMFMSIASGALGGASLGNNIDAGLIGMGVNVDSMAGGAVKGIGDSISRAIGPSDIAGIGGGSTMSGFAGNNFAGINPSIPSPSMANGSNFIGMFGGRPQTPAFATTFDRSPTNAFPFQNLLDPKKLTQNQFSLTP